MAEHLYVLLVCSWCGKQAVDGDTPDCSCHAEAVAGGETRIPAVTETSVPLDLSPALALHRSVTKRYGGSLPRG